MRPPPAVAVALGVVLICAVCLTGTSTARAATKPRASTSACYNFAVGALRQHVVVRRMPSACAGLTPLDVNESIARAIRTVVGPLPKAAERRQAVADSRYLGSLVRSAAAGRPASAVAAPGTTGSTLPARFAALIAWLMAAIAGGRLLLSRVSGGRRGQMPGASAWVLGGHAGLATAGLALWVAFLLTGSIPVGWLDVALTWLIAGLGMAALLGEPPGQHAAGAGTSVSASASAAGLATARGRAPVLTIALHGAFAAITMALVLYAVIGVG